MSVGRPPAQIGPYFSRYSSETSRWDATNCDWRSLFDRWLYMVEYHSNIWNRMGLYRKLVNSVMYKW